MSPQDVVLPPEIVFDDQCNNSEPSSPISVCDETTTIDISPASPFKSKRAGNRRRNRGNSSPIKFIGSSSASNESKSVKFHSRVRFKYIKHIDDYSDREYFATWYVEEDLQAIFNQCVDTVRMMINGDHLDEEEFTPRGLEYKTPTGAKTRKQNKMKGVHVVLHEQERQRSLGVRDPERISRLYREAGADSVLAYRFLAMKDQEEARPIMQSKSSIVVLQEKREKQHQRKQKENRSNPLTMLVEDDLNYSATSVVDELRQSNYDQDYSGNEDQVSLTHSVKFTDVSVLEIP